MSSHNSGYFLTLQGLTLPGIGSSTINDAIGVSLEEIENGADFQDSWLDQMASQIYTVFDDKGYKPNGEHLAGRNVESELIAGREELITVSNDESRDAALRAAVIPEIAKIEQQIQRRDFMKPLRDPEWGADILELVSRMAPHNVIAGRTPEGIDVVVRMTLKIDTLKLVTDDYGEVCSWIYEESSRDVVQP